MSSTITVTLGGIEYVVPKLLVGQLRAIAKLFDGPASEISYEVLGIALKRATPAVEDINLVEAGLDDIAPARDAILIFGGFKKGDAAENPTAPAAETPSAP